MGGKEEERKGKGKDKGEEHGGAHHQIQRGVQTPPQIRHVIGEARRVRQRMSALSQYMEGTAVGHQTHAALGKRGVYERGERGQCAARVRVPRRPLPKELSRVWRVGVSRRVDLGVRASEAFG